VCAADVDVDVGRSVYTPFLNERGTYEADVTVTRTADDAFLVLSSSATTVRDLDWVRRHTPVDAADVTGEFAVLGVMGPSSRALLGGLADDDLTEEGFPFATSREIDLGPARVRATRMTYVGELGWELLVRATDAAPVYDALMSSGAELGVTNAGYYTIESMRLEKGYRAFGRELTPDFGPVEAGLVFATGLKGDKDFLGREALEAHRELLAGGGPRRRLVSFVVADPEPMLWGGELLLREGQPAGQVTSAAWGATVGAAVGLAYLRDDGPVTRESLAGSRFEIDVAGRPVVVAVTLRAPLA
jgi:4-methylaminobutanoate oxidase (formaldehyde-forming)